MIKQAVVLAGGLGTRLGSLTKNTPKPMLKIKGVPFVEHVILNLKRFGIDKIIFSIGYKSNYFIEYFGSSKFGINIEYILEDELLGTGGAIKLAYDSLDSEFFVVNGDSIFDIDYTDFYNRFNTIKNVSVMMALRYSNNASRYGLVDMSNNLVTSFFEKSNKSAKGFVNAGVYIMKKEVLDSIPTGVYSLEYGLFPNLIKKKSLHAKEYDGYFIDIGIPEDFKLAENFLPSWSQNPI